MADRTSAQHAITREDRFLGNGRIHRTLAPGDLISISPVLKDIREALMTLVWMDSKDGIHQILSLNWHAHGRAIPLVWVTVRKDQRKDHRRAIEIGLLKRVAGEWPRSCHPILVADRGFGAIALFHALDALGWDGIIRGKGSTHVEVRPGVWLSLAALAAKKPVLRDLAPVRYGQSSGDQAYRCRIVIGAEPGYSDPGFLLVSRGLRKSRWPARLMTAATGQRFTTEECFRDQKSDWYEGFQPRRGLVRHPGAWGPVLVGVCLGLLRVEWGRVSHGTSKKRSGREGQYRRPPNACVVAFGGLGAPTWRCGVADIIADSRRFWSSDFLAKSTLCGSDGRHLTGETSPPRVLRVCISPHPLSRIESVVPQDAHLGYDLGCFRQPGPHGGPAPRFRDPAWPIASIAAFI